MHMKMITALSFGVLLSTTAAAAQLNAQQALHQFNPATLEKIKKGKINLESLVANDSNDLIIEYDLDTSQLPSGIEKRNYIASNKQHFKNKFSAAAGFQTLREYNGLPLGLYRIQNRETLVKVLNDPSVKAVYPNRINKKSTEESLPLINQPQAVSNRFTGAGTSVAVIDTGVNYLHSDFGCTAVNTPASTCRVVYSTDIAVDDSALDDGDHGTNVSAIVAKVAPKTKIIGLDVFSWVRYQGKWDLTAYDSDILGALNWTANNAKAYNIKSVNLSLGIRGIKYTAECNDTSYTSAFANVRAAGVLPVVASGNDGFTDGIASPACVPGAVRVGAVYDSDMGRLAWSNCTDETTAADKVTCFSNGGRLTTLLAPGALITAGGFTMGGTSQAAPHVAGAIAALRGTNVIPVETLDQTISRLRATGKTVRDHRTGVSFPRLDLLAATNGLSAN